MVDSFWPTFTILKVFYLIFLDLKIIWPTLTTLKASALSKSVEWVWFSYTGSQPRHQSNLTSSRNYCKKKVTGPLLQKKKLTSPAAALLFCPVVEPGTKKAVERVETSPQRVIFLLQWLTWEERSCGNINIVHAKLQRFLNPTLRIKHTLLWPRCHFPTRWFVYPSDFRSSGRVPYSGSKPRDDIQGEDTKKTNKEVDRK